MDTVYGKCYYARTSIYNVSTPGIKGQIRLDISTWVKDRLLRADHDGVYISLLHDGELPHLVGPIELTPGYDLVLPVRLQRFFHHDSICRRDTLPSGLLYSQTECMLEAITQRSLTECGCRPHVAGAIKTSARVCSLLEELSCVTNIRKLGDSIRGDISLCPKACKTYVYDSVIQTYFVRDSVWDFATDGQKSVQQSILAARRRIQNSPIGRIMAMGHIYTLNLESKTNISYGIREIKGAIFYTVRVAPNDKLQLILDMRVKTRRPVLVSTFEYIILKHQNYKVLSNSTFFIILRNSLPKWNDSVASSGFLWSFLSTQK